MSYYGMIWPSYFDGSTGREIVRLGGCDAQICGLYLACGHEANMLGLYRLPLAIMRVRVGSLTIKRLERGLAALGTAGFADYDRISEYVWVRQMAYYRLGLDEKPLSRADNRTIHAQRLYAEAEPNPFLAPFFTRYRSDLHLKTARQYDRPAAVLRLPDAPNPPDLSSDHYLSGLPRGSEGPSKPVTDPVTVPDTETGTNGSSALARTPDVEPMDPPLFEFPVVGGPERTWAFTREHLHRLTELYQNLDVLAECRKGLAWCEANVSHRKTAKGMPRFLVTWMNTATNRAPMNGRAGFPIRESAAAHTLASAREVLLRPERVRPMRGELE